MRSVEFGLLTSEHSSTSNTSDGTFKTACLFKLVAIGATASVRLLHNYFYATGKRADGGPAIPEGMILPVALATTPLEPLIFLVKAEYGVRSAPHSTVADRIRAGESVRSKALQEGVQLIVRTVG